MIILSVRLRSGNDDDLIKWINGINEGDRSTVIRSVLRAHIRNENKQGEHLPSTGEGKEHELVFKERGCGTINKEDLEERLTQIASQF